MLLVRLPVFLFPLPIVSTFAGCLLAVLALPAGLLLFGAVVAVPLGLVAMMNEADPDPIDSLSRGYEYLFRRPLHLAWYIVVCWCLGYAIHLIFSGVSLASHLLLGLAAGVVSPDEILHSSGSVVIETLWLSAQITLQLALLGGVYLLLRRDAGGQHVEEFWIPRGESVESLPKLPKEAFE